MLITYLDKYNIIKERINELLKNIMENILEKENDEIFKLLNCIQNICKISKDYIINYIEIIKQLKGKKYNSKVRCKVMDIEDLLS
jgi:aspartyl/asparaginyl-tRNA synthetase